MQDNLLSLKILCGNTKHKLTVMFKQLSLIKTIKNLIYTRDIVDAFPIPPQASPSQRN